MNNPDYSQEALNTILERQRDASIRFDLNKTEAESRNNENLRLLGQELILETPKALDRLNQIDFRDGEILNVPIMDPTNSPVLPKFISKVIFKRPTTEKMVGWLVDTYEEKTGSDSMYSAMSHKIYLLANGNYYFITNTSRSLNLEYQQLSTNEITRNKTTYIPSILENIKRLGTN